MLVSTIDQVLSVYSVSQKNPPKVFLHFFPNGWEFLVLILHTYYSFLSMLEYKFLCNHLRGIFTQLCHIMRDHPVHTVCSKCPASAETHAGIF